MTSFLRLAFSDYTRICRVKKYIENIALQKCVFAPKTIQKSRYIGTCTLFYCSLRASYIYIIFLISLYHVNPFCVGVIAAFLTDFTVFFFISLGITHLTRESDTPLSILIVHVVLYNIHMEHLHIII